MEIFSKIDFLNEIVQEPKTSTLVFLLKLLADGEVNATSVNGDSLLECMKRDQLIAVNHHPQCTGKWTRQNRINEAEKSVIDYILTTKKNKK